MVLTNERAAMLAEFLNSDKERATKLFDLAPEDALVEINKAGNDFTIDEVVEFGEQLKKAANSNCELDADKLADVSGGLAVEIGVCVALVRLGYTVGKDLAEKHGW